ncbi:protein of unknown function [Algoriphagus locisalis]|uniref:DUF4221 domain-containing protein n=1 Tax=Algoriphagus locisalis TaxID=305507 RepID=A0A1I7APL3_9BACT|nr:DUF4221 family protein [Algoriphagus locisalis]SFT76773.1 protein of unknown function [Algoriphagus locisalis]
MTKYLPLFIILSIVGCAEKSQKSGQLKDLEFSYTIDTVSIDPGEHLFFLGHGLPKAKLSPDERYLYFFDDYNTTFDKVDLVENKYAGTIPLDKEGPKGIGSGFDYAINPDGSFLVLTRKNLLHIDEKGDLLTSEPIVDSLFEIDQEKQFFRYAQLSSDQRYFFGLTSANNQGRLLGWIDRLDSMYHEVKADSMAYTENLKIDLGAMSISGIKEVKYLNKKILLFHDEGIDIYSLDPTDGNWEFHDNNPKLIEKRKPGNYSKTGEIADASKILAEKNLEVYYHPMVYDSENKRYYRVASKKRENQSRGTVSDQVLFIFSEDFELIHEEDLSDFSTPLTGYFIRDGKFWMKNNDTEELEFLVFDFQLN